MNLGYQLAWRNLWRHPRRTWLTTGAMIFSNVLLIFAVSLQLGTYDMMVENGLRVLSGHLQIQHEKYFDKQRINYSIPISDELVQQVNAVPGVAAVALRAEGFALASSAERSYGIQIMGVQPTREAQVSNLPGLVVEGRYLNDSAVEKIVLGRVLARNLKVAPGDEITIFGSGKDGSAAAAILTVVGIFESNITELDRAVAQIPLQNFQDIFSMQGEVHRAVITTYDLEQVPAVEQAVSQLIADTSSARVLDWDTLQPELRQAIQADMASISFIYLVLIVLVAFSVLNTQLMSVLERTREYGIMLALGLTPGRLGRLVLLETALMAVIGLVGGVLLGAALVAWLSQTGFTYPGMEEMSAKFNLPSRIYPPLSFGSAILGPASIFAASLVAALYPALRLRRLQPVEAMGAP